MTTNITSTSLDTTVQLPSDAPPAAQAVLRMMRQLRHGRLHVQLPDGGTLRFGSEDGPVAAIRLANWKVCAAALRSGDIGFAESYIAGDWTSPDLAALLRMFIANRDDIENVIYGSWWGRALYRMRHLFNRNSKAGSRKNIHAHYDLGNEFYRLWLDDTMSYSSAWFPQGQDVDMVQAQWAKVDRALRMTDLREGDRLLEIGCGWGALAEQAARRFGAKVTGVTLSAEQLAYGQQRLVGAGLSEQAQLRFQDYRDIDDGPYDAIASIEMVEAVGREYWDSYFSTVARLLKPGGKACIQSIVIDDRLFDRYLGSTDFIQQYIFPGGCLPSPQAFRQASARAGLRVIDELRFGADYAETLKRWRERFMARDQQVRQLGFDTRFMRIWEFYLAYCEAAFSMGNTDVMQFTLVKD